MKNLYTKASVVNSAKFLFQNRTSGGRIENASEAINRTSVELANLKDEVSAQNAILNQVKKDLDKLKTKNLLETKIIVTKRDTLGALALGFDKSATKKYKQENHLTGKLTKEQHTQKEININWNTTVEYSNGKTVTLSQANDIYPGDTIYFSKNANGQTVIHVLTSNAGVSPTLVTNTPQSVQHTPANNTTTTQQPATTNNRINLVEQSTPNNHGPNNTQNQQHIYVEQGTNNNSVQNNANQTTATLNDNTNQNNTPDVLTERNNKNNDMKWDKSDLFYKKFITNDPEQIRNIKENNEKIAKNTKEKLPKIEETANKLKTKAAKKSTAKNAVIDSVRDESPFDKMGNDNERWEYLKKKRANLINSKRLQDYEQVSENAEEASDILTATKAIKKLYELRKTRDEVTKDDIENKETDFMKKYLAAKSAYDKVTNKNNVPNAKIFEDIRHGKLRMELVEEAKKLMEELPDVKNPVANDFEKVEKIIDIINAARKYGPVNDLLEGREVNDPKDDTEILTEFLVKARRANHMKVKETTQTTYTQLTDKYPNPKYVTEDDIDNRHFISLVNTLAENTSNYQLNETRDPEKDNKEKVWPTKWINQETANNIEAYVLRIEQLQMSQDFVQKFKQLPKILFTKKPSKNIPKESPLPAFYELDLQLNLMAEKYEVAGAKTLQSDLLRMGGRNILQNIQQARNNIDVWYDSYLSKYPVDRKVEINKADKKKDLNISFKEIDDQ